jgi:hypothetical protein
LRGKWNFTGNEGGERALGVIIDVTLPTAADGLGNDGIEGTLILPVAFKLPGGWDLGAMVGVAAREGANGSGRRGVLIATTTVSHDLSETVGGYLELTSESGDGSHVATFNTGLTLSLGENAQLDCGANLGISEAAPDLGVFAGWARRF